MANFIGAPTSRVDGRAKVTGEATYAAEFNAPGCLYGAVVTSPVARGRIERIDADLALGVEGVFDVLTHENRPPMADADPAYADEVAPPGSPFRPLYNDRILFSGQPVALVLARDWETARFAASQVWIDYRREPHATDLLRPRKQAFTLKGDAFAMSLAKPRGDAAQALARAPVRHAADYFIPVEHHNPMELFASTVIRADDGKLVVYDKTQGVQNVQRYLCNVFHLAPEELRVISPFVGGAFGSGLRPQYQVALAVLAALAVKRSVRLVLTRQQMFALGFRPATVETVALGAGIDGALEAVTHEALAMTSQYESFARNDSTWSGALYKCANASYAHRLAPLDLPTPCDMRAPGAASGVYALECAMDELAVALKLDPLELRYRAYSELDQNEDKPFTSKALRECYRQGADAFGWARRSAEPRSMRDGGELIGWGMATGIWEALQMKFSVRIALSVEGKAEAACATSDIGTGTYTIMSQAAADMLGLPLENVTVKLGDSTLPQAPVEGGSWTAASTIDAIAQAADAVKSDLLELARRAPGSPLAGLNTEEVSLADGRILSRRDPSLSARITDVMRCAGVERIERERTTDIKRDDAHARNTHSAVFAEVRVDEQLGVIRVMRVVSAIAAGRILNPKTARSQILGGVVWGIGMALHEETLIDLNFGRFMNANIAEYHMPTNADVGEIEVIFVDERDALINPLGVKGLGEIGIVGVAAAIANAIYHATGKRVRDLPITLDKLN